MRTLVKRVVVSGMAAGLMIPLAATSAAAAPAAPEPGLYAPTALVLTVAPGEDAGTANPARAVTLSCTPTASGTHPAPRAACAELNAVQGDFTRLGDDAQGRPCVKIWSPVTVTAQGIWQGERVNFSHTYGNSCELQAEGAVFSF
ncbi:subtilase-type protease inhibitor [Streptomyces lichenis]|uniref:Probable subtilase-type protease inhibitor n=1 Tax=Streptomyces lichenis TaxID=2306967 RepID=A0ABT0I8T2_9ACTN|nr:subtilase-type protease inhibitor [Streptomyces lichenis]MCK8677725.1 subtilase-type protease inhibitor [Streptomyces lichenis]